MSILQSLYSLLHRLPFLQKYEDKQSIRRRLNQYRRSLSPQQVASDSRAIVDRLLLLPTYQQAKRIMIYYPIQNEVDITSLVHISEQQQDGKTFYLPVSHEETIELRLYTSSCTMVQGRFGIPEPQGEAYLGDLDLIIIPGVGFDRHHQRLGRGKGYYDRFLSSLAHKHIPTIGVAYDGQIVNHLPTEKHDQPIQHIITPTIVL